MRHKSDKALLTIFLIVFVDLLGFGIVLPLLPYIAEQYRATPWQIGILAATYSLFQLLAGPVLGRLSDRYGRRKLLAVSQFGSAIGFAILGFANSLPLLFLSRIIDGITGGNISIAQAYIADVTTPENRAKGMGILGAAFGLGFIFGPALGGFLSRFGYGVPAYFAMGVALITVILTLLTLPETVSTEQSRSPRARFTLREFWRIATDTKIEYLVVIFFVLNFAFSMMQGVFALWTERRFRFGPEQNGYIFMFVGILSVIAQLRLLPFMVKRFREEILLKYSSAIFAVGFVIMALSPNIGILLLSQMMIVLGNSMGAPSLQALASENVPKEEYGGTLGFLQSAGAMGRIAGPMAGGILFGIAIHLPYLASAGLMGLVALYLFIIRGNSSHHRAD